jgi:hypothetical protein
MSTIWEASGKGYFKNPVRVGADRLFLSENRDFGWDRMGQNRSQGQDEYDGTRGEAVIHLDKESMRKLAELVLKESELNPPK